MKQVASCDGQDLREMFAAATSWLEKSAADVDALNVFPVPDGDTGTNMLLTMRSLMEEAYRAPDRSASAVSQAMAHGALMGARGNSGVILSQFYRGLAIGLEGKKSLNGSDFAVCLSQASVMAYRGISHPVEGTILTVIRDASDAAQEAASGDMDDLLSVMEAAVNAARDSVARTPTLLPVLREAGVVDAGGQGLYIVLDGGLRYLKGEVEEMCYRRPQIIASSLPLAMRMPSPVVEEKPYGYCTEFLLQGEKIDTERIRARLEGKGESLMVVGDSQAVRVHIHTLDPGTIIRYATSQGTLNQVSIRNMDEQHRDYMEMQRARAPVVDIGIVAVVAGAGLAEVFRSLGAAAIVPGGQTMNPSIRDLLRAVESLPADKVIILPNNSNVILTANQVQALTDKKIEVVPTETIPQGTAALLSFNYETDLETNAQAMDDARTGVKTVEVTKAVRSTNVSGLKVKKGQAIGLVDGDLVAAGDSLVEVLDGALSKTGLERADVVTIYYGADTQPADAEEAGEKIRQSYPQVQVEIIRGDQPHYNYIVSVE